MGTSIGTGSPPAGGISNLADLITAVQAAPLSVRLQLADAWTDLIKVGAGEPGIDWKQYLTGGGQAGSYPTVTSKPAVNALNVYYAYTNGETVAGMTSKFGISPQEVYAVLAWARDQKFTI